MTDPLCLSWKLVAVDLGLFFLIGAGWAATLVYLKYTQSQMRAFFTMLDRESKGQLADWVYPHDPIRRRALEQVFARTRLEK